MMVSKMGRPVIGKPKTIDVKVRLDEDTHKRVLEYSEKHNITKSETIRRGIDLLIEKK
jgi:hypothetical protein cdifQCD_20516